MTKSLPLTIVSSQISLSKKRNLPWEDNKEKESSRLKVKLECLPRHVRSKNEEGNGQKKRKDISLRHCNTMVRAGKRYMGLLGQEVKVLANRVAMNSDENWERIQTRLTMSFYQYLKSIDVVKSLKVRKHRQLLRIKRNKRMKKFKHMSLEILAVMNRSFPFLLRS